MTNQQPTIGVAISGGGHRASLFGLGALLYLIDADKGAHLGSVASVSGGSLTNAFFGSKSTWPPLRPKRCGSTRKFSPTRLPDAAPCGRLR